MKTTRIILSACLIVMLLPSCSGNEKPVNNEEISSVIQTPEMDIHTAVLHGNLEVVQQHIAAGTDLDSKEPMSGSTALISAITFNHPQIAQALIEAGANLEIQNNDGSSPLHVAAFFCRIEMVKTLLDLKVDTTKKNNFGTTALETVRGPFANVKPIYELMQAQLGPLGLNLDLNELEKNRPIVAELISQFNQTISK